jgi:hypothetical protein
MQTVELTQSLMFDLLGGYPRINDVVTVYKPYLDEGYTVRVEATREFFIQDQNYAEFWEHLRPEFWPMLAYDDYN